MAVAAAFVAMLLPAPGPPCEKRFTLAMDERGASAIYAGTMPLTRHERGLLRRLVRCQRRPGDRARARRYNRRVRGRWLQRRIDAMTMQVALASYYTTEGVGACGYGSVQGGYRFASLFLPCGAQVRFCYGSSCVDATMSDRGPYVGGRSFDLNLALKDALGCPGLCYVRWREL